MRIIFDPFKRAFIAKGKPEFSNLASAGNKLEFPEEQKKFSKNFIRNSLQIIVNPLDYCRISNGGQF